MILIIAEKPSLGRNIISALGGMTRRDGYYEGKDFLVTWAFGHLFSLAEIDRYSPNPDGSNRWTMATLPCFPQKFVYELREDKTGGVKRQFETVRKLCLRSDVDTVVNAGDADREGEIIVRTLVSKAFDGSVPKPMKRLWLPDQTEGTIREALADMKDDGEYKNLAYEGYARTFIDWLYGMNLSRFATLKTGTLLRVGRVIVPIVKAIYDRDNAIKNFVPEEYFAIISKTGRGSETLELVSKTKFKLEEKSQADEFCQKYNNAQTTVTDVKRKQETVFPGKLYSLTKLQNFLGKKYKMPMDKSLSVLQKLYEEGYVTYPRTNSEYLATAEKDKVKNVISRVKGIGYPVTFKDTKSVFDDTKIEAHSALTPTVKIPDKSKLSADEAKVYGAVMRRFVAVFCSEPCKADKTEITLDTGGFEQFTLKGTVIVEPGWTKYDDYTAKDKILPKLNAGDVVKTAFAPVKKETTPPRHYTIETLNNYLKNPFRDEKAAENEDEEYKAVFEGLELGTEATRTGIIDNARKSKYILLTKDVYTILPAGEFLIESLSRLGIGMDKYKTAEIGKALKKIYRGEMTVNAGIALAEDEIKSVFDSSTADGTGFFGDVIGKCPLCGGDIKRGTYAYGCSNYKDGCKMRIPLFLCGRTITAEEVACLLDKGETELLNGFKSKKGKDFSAVLKLEGDTIKFSFDNAKPAERETAPLPDEPPERK